MTGEVLCRQEARRAIDAASRDGVVVEDLQHRDDIRETGADVRDVADAERRHAVAKRGQLREDLVDPNLQEVRKPAGESDAYRRRCQKVGPMHAKRRARKGEGLVFVTRERQNSDVGA